MTGDEGLMLEAYGALHCAIGLYEHAPCSVDWLCEVADGLEERLKDGREEAADAG